MRMTRRTMTAGAVAIAVAAGALGAAAAFGGGEAADDADERATGPDADRAAAAALARFPGGRVTAVERDDDDGGGWEVEMTRGDGATVDVDVDRSFGIVAVDDPE